MKRQKTQKSNRLRDLRRGAIFWVMTDTGFKFDPKNRIKTDAIWTSEDIKRFCVGYSHPRRFVKVKVLEAKGYWQKHTDD